MKKTTSTTKKRRKRTERSPRQQWHSERNWELKGSLAGIVVRLSQLAKLDSTILEERQTIMLAAAHLDTVKHLLSKRKEESYKLFCKRKGFIP